MTDPSSNPPEAGPTPEPPAGTPADAAPTDPAPTDPAPTDDIPAGTAPDPARADWEPAVLALATALRSGDGWKPGEEEMRRRELATTRRSLTYNRITAASAALAAVAAAVAAGIGGWAVMVAREANADQTVEARFSDSIRAIGSDQPTERIAGFIMLRRNVEQRLRGADRATDPSETVSFYGTAVEVLASYLKSVPRQPDQAPVPPPAAPSATQPVQPPVQPVAPAADDPAADDPASDDPALDTPPPGTPAVTAPVTPAAAGKGTAPTPIERQYAAKQLSSLLGRENRDLVLRHAPLPLRISVDLAGADLYGMQLAGVDFSWVSGKYFAAVDLRAATLTRSKWGDAFLGGASLQCANLGAAHLNDDAETAPRDLGQIIGADLNQAHLEGANLAGADLRKANLVGAHLDGADITGARFDGADLTGAHLDGVLGRDATGVVAPGAEGRRYDKRACARDLRLPGFGG